MSIEYVIYPTVTKMFSSKSDSKPLKCTESLKHVSFFFPNFHLHIKKWLFNWKSDPYKVTMSKLIQIPIISVQIPIIFEAKILFAVSKMRLIKSCQRS